MEDAREKALQEASIAFDKAIKDTINETIAKQSCDKCGHTLIMNNAENMDEVLGKYNVSTICVCGADAEFEISLADAYGLVAEKLTKDEDKIKQLIKGWKENKIKLCGT